MMTEKMLYLEEENKKLKLENEQLKNNEKIKIAEYENLINTANASIVGVDNNLNITIWNNKLAELSGFNYNDTINNKLEELFNKNNSTNNFSVKKNTTKAKGRKYIKRSRKK